MVMMMFRIRSGWCLTVEFVVEIKNGWYHLIDHLIGFDQQKDGIESAVRAWHTEWLLNRAFQHIHKVNITTQHITFVSTIMTKKKTVAEYKYLTGKSSEMSIQSCQPSATLQQTCNEFLRAFRT